jgi:hypothetical protein
MRKKKANVPSSNFPQSGAPAPLHSLQLPRPAASVEFPFSPAATVLLAPVGPLTTPLPFHPAVRAHLDEFGIAVVKPPFMDQHTLQNQLEVRAMQVENYKHGYRMTLGCFNQQEEVGSAAVKAAAREVAGDQDASYPSVPTPDEVFEFIEKQWVHMQNGVGPLPRLSSTEQRVYVKDVSAGTDLRAGGGGDSLSFFPPFDQLHSTFLQEAIGEDSSSRGDRDSDMSQEEEKKEDDKSCADGGKNEETRDYLLSAKKKLECVLKEHQAIRKRNGTRDRTSYLFHPLYQGRCSDGAHKSCSLRSCCIYSNSNCFVFLFLFLFSFSFFR